MTSKGYALARAALVQALTVWWSFTTADGADNGSTLIDSTLIGKNDFVSNKTILIASGDAKWEDSGASSFEPVDGTITVVSPFSHKIKAGTIYRILNISTVEIDVEAINTKVGTNTDAAGTTTLFARLKQIVDTYLANGTIGLAALKALIATIPTTAERGTDNALLAASYTAPDNAGIATLLARVTAAVALASICTEARLAELDAANIPAYTDPRAMGRKQIKEVSVTSAANAGDVVLTTVTTQPCLIESIVIHADAAQTGDLISCGVFGGAGKVITFISAADAVQANLDAEDKQVAWTGAVRLAATKTIVMTLVGSNGTAVDLTVTITFRACAWGGVM